MNGLSVIIPSRNAANLVPCVEMLRDHEPTVRIIVVDDGLDLSAADARRQDENHCWLCDMDPTLRIPGKKPFCFSVNVNHGIQVAGFDDVVILGDDGLLESENGFSLLQYEAERRPEVGIIGCTTNVTGAQCQYRQNVGLRIVDNFAFVAVLIPRRTIEAVGLLDERFTTYGWEDNDYIHRVKLAGLKVAVHDFCYVDHGSLKSTFRTGNGAGDIEPGRRIFEEKWGACSA